jgi:hypothetical protein
MLHVSLCSLSHVLKHIYCCEDSVFHGNTSKNPRGLLVVFEKDHFVFICGIENVCLLTERVLNGREELSLVLAKPESFHFKFELNFGN